MTPDEKRALLEEIRQAARDWRNTREDQAIAEADARTVGLTEDEIRDAKGRNR